MKAQTKEGGLVSVAVDMNSPVYMSHRRKAKLAEKKQRKAFTAYKKALREQKKKIPLAERSKMNWSRVPERYL